MRKRVYCDTTAKTIKALNPDDYEPETPIKRVSKPTNDKRLPLGVYDEDINDIVSTWLKSPLTLKCPILLDCDECGRCIRK